MTAEDDDGADADDCPKVAGAAETSESTALLHWDQDVDAIDPDDSLEAQGQDWRYVIYPALGPDGDIIGYHVTGGDSDSCEDIGSVTVDGKRGELTLAAAKAAAQTNYEDRLREADQFLDDLIGDWEDDDGTQTRRNGDGSIICRVNEPDVDEVEVVVTLRDYADHYDAATRRATVSLRTVLSYSYNGDPAGLVDDVRRLIRVGTS